MPIKKRRVRSNRRGSEPSPAKATMPVLASPQVSAGNKTWIDRLLELIKIGIGLANLVVNLGKH